MNNPFGTDAARTIKATTIIQGRAVRAQLFCSACHQSGPPEAQRRQPERYTFEPDYASSQPMAEFAHNVQEFLVENHRQEVHDA